MGKKLLGILVVLGLVLGLGPVPVVADDVTVYPTEDTYIREDFDDENYGSLYYWIVNDWESDAARAIIRIDDQTGGGNITSVLLKAYYSDYLVSDPDGKKIRVYRCLEDAKEMEATWVYWKDGWEWTSEGGDYTTENYAEAEMPSGDGWVTWNITDMAFDAWVEDEEDLYVIIRYKYETKGPGTASVTYFRSNEYSGSTYDPQVVVTYEEAVQTPEVEGDINEYGSAYVKLNIYPTLYDWPTANITAQVAISGEPWALESAVLTVTDNSAVTRTVAGLNQSTAYVARGKLVYASGTVYSANVSFTTKNYNVPTWDIDIDNIESHSAQVYAGWTNNTNNKTVYTRVYYKRTDFGTWSFTDLEYSSDEVEEFAWNITELRENTTYEYEGRFVIDGYAYWTEPEEWSSLEAPELDTTAIDVDYYYFQLQTDYECKEVDEIALQARTRPDGTTEWTYSDTRTGLTGNGTEYWLFENLLPAIEYEWYVTATYEGGATSTYDTLWTAAIDEYPVLTGLQASFVAPNIIRVSVDIELNDVSVSALDPELYADYRPTWEIPWRTSTDRTDISGDGEWSVDLICGDELLWDSTYDFYAVLDYTVGTNETDPDVFYTPEEPFAVETVEFVGLSGTRVTFSGRVQVGGLDSAECKFLYWVQGSGTQHSTAEVTMTSSGVYDIDVSGLVYGEYYSFQAYSRATDASLPAVSGSAINFRAGYWDETVPPADDGVYSVYGAMWNWLTNSTAGHWTILLCGMVVAGLLFHRRREVAIVVCLFILGIGIVIGWVDTWVIVLLALGAGLTIWRFVTGNRGSAV